MLMDRLSRQRECALRQSYLKGAHDRRTMMWCKKSPLSRQGTFADSDFAEDKQDRRSLSWGAALYVGRAAELFSRTKHCVML